MFEVYGLKTGERAVDTYLLSYRTGEHGLTTIAYYFWCLKGPDGITIVDTGGAVEEARKRGVLGIRRQEDLLAKIGVEAKAVKRVILTHLHWDHFGRWQIFPNARFYLQRKEVDFFSGSMIQHEVISRSCSNTPDIVTLQKEGRVQLIDGEEAIGPGLALLWVGCHTPGSQVIIAETSKGKMVLCGDLHYLYGNIVENVPSLIQLDVPECLASFEKVKKVVSSPDLLIPGHDPLLMSKYPQPGDGVARVA